MSRAKALSFTLSAALGLCAVAVATYPAPVVTVPLLGGPFLTSSVRTAAATSADGRYTVEVIHRRPEGFRFRGVEVVANVYDSAGRKLAERLVREDGCWCELDGLFHRITIDEREIRIGPDFDYRKFYVIRLSELENR